MTMVERAMPDTAIDGHDAEPGTGGAEAALLPLPTAGDGDRPVTASRARRLLAQAGPPVAVFLGVLVLWHLVSTRVLAPGKRFLLPAPLDVLNEGLLDGRNRTEELSGLWSTTEVALLGLAVAIVVGVLVAIVMHQARWVERSIYPYAVVLQTIPILAVVPLIGFWFGFELFSRVLVCAVIAVFPVITNTLFGLKSVPAGHHDLFRLHKAGRWQRLTKLELPTALPAMITGFRISAGLAVVGAIVADFFFRQGDPGIGRLIDVYRQRLATEQLFTAIFLSSLLGLVVFAAFGWIGGRVDRSRHPRRD